MPPQEEADGKTQEEKDELEDAPDRSDLLAYAEPAPESADREEGSACTQGPFF
jgi:hypothetical protein